MKSKAIMSNTLQRVTVALALSLAVVACEQAKSSNPLSPLIAGPIAGVEVTTPKLLEPPASKEIAVELQPVALVIENASTNGVRPVSYTFQVATDALFLNPVYSKSGVPSGEGGRTTHRLPDALGAEQTYYWRAKADDGANGSDYTSPASFRIFTPVVINEPTPKSPANGSTITTRKPTLVIQNASRTGPAGVIKYLFEAADSPTMAIRIASVEVSEGSGGETSYAVPTDLPYATPFFWRVRAFDPTHVGPWSPVFSFVTPAAPPPVPTPPPAPPPGGGGGGGSTGDELNLNDVTWVKGVPIANWAVTSTLTRVTSGSDFCTEHTMAGRWPILGFFDIPGVTVEGNQIMIANINGKWYGGGGEWLRPGQVCKFLGNDVGASVYYDSPPLQYWSPKTGEVVGVAVSTPSRAGQWGTAERSNVILIRWGQ